MLPIGLMLLDLIEVGARYGAGSNKGYTFEALLAGKSANQDGTIDRATGGKHPMCHDNSIKQANTMFESFNPSHRSRFLYLSLGCPSICVSSLVTGHLGRGQNC